MESSQHNFNCDETPTPTRFIRNCEEVGLFQDLQNNPFEETFRIAVQSSSQITTRSLPEPLSKSVEVDTLDTPQVVPNFKRIEDYQNTYPIMEDDEDEEDAIKLSNNYLEYLLPKEYYETSVTETKTQQTTVVEINVHNDSKTENQKNDETEINVVDLTMSPDDPPIMKMQTETIRSKIVKEVFFENEEQNLINNSITNEFLILHKDKIETKENNHKILKPNITSIPVSDKTNTSSPSIIANKNVFFIPSERVANSSISGTIMIHPKPESSEPTIKQKLKSFLKPSENITPQTTNKIANCQNASPNVQIDVHDDRVMYSRERNRIAQKRCRLKKQKWISQLKKDTESVYEENKSLRSEISSLKTEIAQLKTLLLAHKNCPVTQAMRNADISSMLPKDPISNNRRQRPQIPSNRSNICNGNMVAGSQNLHVIKSNIDPNKKLVIDSKTVPISQLRGNHNCVEKRPMLKVFIGKNTNKRQPKKVVNSPNAVKVIHFHHSNNSEVTDLTYDSS